MEQSDEKRERKNDEDVDNDQESCGSSDPEADNQDAESQNETINKKRKAHRLSLTKTEDFNERLRKRGVIYVARVPPRMTPTKMKQLLGQFGTVSRIYLVEEDASVRKRRRKNGGSGRKRYTEGWVEFERKKIAKHVAQNLNATPISNYKRDAHYGDLWGLKYLSGFKWSHLTEKVAYERRVREQKLRVELMQARRENAAYTELVEQGQKLDKIEARRKRKQKMDDTSRIRKQPKQKKSVTEGAEKSAKKTMLGALM